MNDLSVGRSVRLSVCPVHCAKTVDRIRMQFGIIGRTSPGMRQVVRFGIRSTGRGTFGGEFRARHCNVTNGDITAYVCDSALTVEAAFGVVRAVERGIAVLHGVHVVRGEGSCWGFLFPIFTMGNAIGSPTVKCFRFVRENFTTFPFGKRIVAKPDSWAFCRYIHFPDQRRGL